MGMKNRETVARDRREWRKPRSKKDCIAREEDKKKKKKEEKEKKKKKIKIPP
jgi:hypothetical protein